MTRSPEAGVDMDAPFDSPLEWEVACNTALATLGADTRGELFIRVSREVALFWRVGEGPVREISGWNAWGAARVQSGAGAVGVAQRRLDGTHAVRGLLTEAAQALHVGGHETFAFPEWKGRRAEPVATVSSERLTSRVSSLDEKLRAFGALTFHPLLGEEKAAYSILCATGMPACHFTSERTRVLARAETLAGALVDGLSSESLDSGWSESALLQRLGEVDALASTWRPALSRAEPGAGLPWHLHSAAAGPLVLALTSLFRGDLPSGGLARVLGKKIFPPSLSITEGPSETGGPALDDEGTPMRAQTLVDAGRVQALLHSQASAKRAGIPPGGNVVRTAPHPSPAVAARHVVLASGGAPLPPDRNEAIVHLQNFHPAPSANRASLILAGYVVEDGKRVRPLGPLELELGVLESFRLLTGTTGNVQALPAWEGVNSPDLLFSTLSEAK